MLDMLEIGKVKIGAGFILFIAVWFYFDEDNLFLLFLLAAGIHETGHFICLRIFGGRAENIKLNLLGAVIKCDPNYRISYTGEIMTAIAGPMANIIAALCVSFFGAVYGERFYFLSGVCVIMGAFNLLPAMPLDGGRALYHAVCAARDPFCAAKVTGAVSKVLSMALLVTGAAILFYSGSNFSLLAVGAMLAGMSFLRKGEEKAGSEFCG